MPSLKCPHCHHASVPDRTTSFHGTSTLTGPPYVICTSCGERFKVPVEHVIKMARLAKKRREEGFSPSIPSSPLQHKDLVHILYDEYGQRRSEEEVINEYGAEYARMALLREARHERLEDIELEIKYPCRIFISYKWGDARFNRTVKGIASTLKNIGWDVVFDGNNPEVENRDIASLISKLQTCNLYLGIITPGFITDAVNVGKASWLFDEWQIASLMALNYEIEFVGLWLQGEEKLPLEHLFDLREKSDKEIQLYLENNFPYNGPTLNKNQKSRIVSALEGYRNVQTRSQHDFEAVFNLSNEFPFVGVLHWEICKFVFEDENYESAIDQCLFALQSISWWDNITRFIHLMMHAISNLGDDSHCAGMAADALKHRPNDVTARYLLGKSLLRLGDYLSARNHLQIAANDRNASPHVFLSLSQAYQEMGDDEMSDYHFTLGDKLFEYIDEAYGDRHLARLRINRELPALPLFSMDAAGYKCSDCDSIYHPNDSSPALCGLCAGHRSPFPGEPCNFCGHRGIVLPSLVDSGLDTRCPTCRKGNIIPNT